MSNLAYKKYKSKKYFTKKSFKLFKHRLTVSDYLLIVILLSLCCVQFIKWSASLKQPKVNSQITVQKKEFITSLVEIAKKEQARANLLPSVTLAQAALESNFGRSELASKYHNLFGVKSENNDTGALMTTKEYVNGQWITVKARFAIYANYEESIIAHTNLFLNGTKWDHNLYQKVLAATTYQQAAQALQTAGYATDPNYAQKLIDLIQQYQLNQYD